MADLHPNPQLTFERFIIGECNRLAHGAALTVAEAPGEGFNPLFVCGPPGVGKTHLLHSIAAFLLTHSPATVVRLSAGEGFTTEFLHALRTNHIDTFKARFRRVDVLLLDDVQFLQHKAHTEEEFFHTFNALHDLGSQIVMTSDRTPRELKDLERRLRERFEAGLVADIHPPDPRTRNTILQKKIREQGIRLADHNVIDLLADHATTSVRALEGALIRLVAVASLTNRAITTELAAEVLSPPCSATKLSQTTNSTTTITEIQTATCKYFQVSRADLLSARRAHRLTWPRHLAMALARDLTTESLPTIGYHFGHRDHTTVLYACRRTQDRITRDPQARNEFYTLRSTLQA
jgi:chromosomal replication initiator protein